MHDKLFAMITRQTNMITKLCVSMHHDRVDGRRNCVVIFFWSPQSCGGISQFKLNELAINSMRSWDLGYRDRKELKLFGRMFSQIDIIP